MRAGRAIVATNVGGNTESVRHDREALVVDAGDVDALANALRKLCDDGRLRATLGHAATKRFESHFTVDQMLGRTADWLMTCGGRASSQFPLRYTQRMRGKAASLSSPAPRL